MTTFLAPMFLAWQTADVVVRTALVLGAFAFGAIVLMAACGWVVDRIEHRRTADTLDNGNSTSEVGLR